MQVMHSLLPAVTALMGSLRLPPRACHVFLQLIHLQVSSQGFLVAGITQGFCCLRDISRVRQSDLSDCKVLSGEAK